MYAYLKIKHFLSFIITRFKKPQHTCHVLFYLCCVYCVPRQSLLFFYKCIIKRLNSS